MSPSYKAKLASSASLVDSLVAHLAEAKSREERGITASAAFARSSARLVLVIVTLSKRAGIPLPSVPEAKGPEGDWRTELDLAMKIIELSAGLVTKLAGERGPALVDEADDKSITELWEKIKSITDAALLSGSPSMINLGQAYQEIKTSFSGDSVQSTNSAGHGDSFPVKNHHPEPIGKHFRLPSGVVLSDGPPAQSEDYTGLSRGGTSRNRKQSIASDGRSRPVTPNGSVQSVAELPSRAKNGSF